MKSEHFVLISHFFTWSHTSSSVFMFSFLLHHCWLTSSRVAPLCHLHVAPSRLDSVSSESQSYHRTTSLVCFGCVTLCHQICFILLCVNVCKICQLFLYNILHIHVLQHHMFHSSKSSLGCPCFCRLTVGPNSCKICFVTIASATPVVRTFYSASAELKLTACCVRDHCCECCITPLHNSVTCALARGSLSCPIAVCMHVHELWRCNDFDQALCTRSAFQIFLQYASRSSRGSQLDTWSFLLFPSRCTWRLLAPGTCTIVFPTTVLYIARLSPSSSTSDSVVGVLFTLGVITGFASSQPRTLITFRTYFGFASTEYPRAVRAITLPRK